jgi:hypothetical protein
VQRAFAITAGLVVLLITLLFFGYLGWRLVDDVRGPRVWQATLERLRQHGEPTDFAQLIPPRIPDAVNLAAIPLFQVEREAGSTVLEPLRLKAALKNINESTSEMPRNGWTKGRSVDAAALDRFLSGRFHQVFPGRPLPPSPLDQFDALCPAIAELRQAAASRPTCRFDRDYTTMPPFFRSLGSTTEFIALAKVINLHAIAALQAQKPALALQDIELDLELDTGLRQEPQLVSGLVAAGVVSIQLDAIWEGIETHAWSDAQLAELQRSLEAIDFLADDQLCLRGEALGYFAPTIDYLKQHQATTSSLVIGLAKPASDTDNHALLALLWKLTPPGSFDVTKAEGVALDFEAAREPIDLVTRRVYPDRLDANLATARHSGGHTMPGVLEHESAPPIVAALVNFSECQFRVDAARVACMIERYRLAHGALPSTLDQLAPEAGVGGMPHDVCNGQPLHYAARTDGTYLLYSVGWNQLDDGGRVDYKADEPKAVDPRSGDWVWPQPGRPGS